MRKRHSFSPVLKVASVFLLFTSITHSQSPPPPCAADQPPCSKNTVPMPGHGAANDLPQDQFLCPNEECRGDNRRVITVRIDSSWEIQPSGTSTPTQTNVNVWNAVLCAISMWNHARDPNDYPTGYYFVLDQGGKVPGKADITIVRQAPATGAPARLTPTPVINSDMVVAGYSGPFTMMLNPEQTSFQPKYASSANADTLCGTLAHELGHAIGLEELSTICQSIMTGEYPNGIAIYNNVTPADVIMSNNNFDLNRRPNCAGGYGQGSRDIVDVGPPACDQYTANDCYINTGTWDSFNCSCSYPWYGGGYGVSCYDYYSVHSATTCVGANDCSTEYYYQYEYSACY